MRIGWTGRGGVVAAGLLAALSGCEAEIPTGVTEVAVDRHQVDVLGGLRSYRLFVPPSVTSTADPVPLLLVFHGATQSATGIELLSWLYPAADEAGLLVAYPEASGDYWATPNSRPSYWNVPDVPFVDALVDDVARRHPVDRDRVFVAGYSNGAIFAQVVACLRGEDIAGMALVGAPISAEVARSCSWTRPVPSIVFFGDADTQFFWDDGLAGSVGMLGGAASAAWLAESNGCEPRPEVTDLGPDPDSRTGAEVWRYTGCDAGADVDFYRIRRGGHTWPGSPVNMEPRFGWKNRAVDASRLMVTFFLEHAPGDDQGGDP